MSSIEPEHIDFGNFFVRLLYIVSYVIILGIVRFILWGVLLVQMVLHLFGASPSPSAQRVGQNVADYIYRIWLYLSYNTDEKPFPFNRRKEV
ncbi:MAG: DUF4389 domain-containing protein [Methylococcaceae bacterium]|jgi:hypothetical protein|nr:DUF4389 domain-containing protein [Methylococcaceae bacterium]